MKKVITLSMMLVMLSLLLGGCASKQQVESIEARSRRTSEEQRRLIMQLERELAEAQQQLSQEIERTNTPVAQKTADIWVELNSLRQQFALLTGQVEVMQVRMDNQLGSANATMPTLRERLSAVEFAMENDLNVELETVAAMEAARSASPRSAEQGVAAAESNGTAAEPVAAPEPEKKAADPAKALYDRAMGNTSRGITRRRAPTGPSFPRHSRNTPIAPAPSSGRVRVITSSRTTAAPHCFTMTSSRSIPRAARSLRPCSSRDTP